MDKDNNSPQMTAASSTASTGRPSVAAHTKGKWFAEGPDEFGDYNIVLYPSSDKRAVAAVVDNMRPKAEVAANARLIAAAPDLLEALKAVMNDLMLLGSVTDTTSMRASEAIGKATTK